MKIGFFGGSFNPPTIAHYNLIKQALIQYNFDEVYFVPVNDYYNKANLINIDNRIDMLNILCNKEKNIKVLSIEKEISHKLETIEILTLIQKQFSNNDLYFFMGEDNYKKMNTWKDYEKLQKFNYIVFQRNENKELKITQKNVQYMKNTENQKISSTLIRKRIKDNQPINDLVTKEIETYIKENNLYIV